MQWLCQKWLLSFRQAGRGFGEDSADSDESATVQFREKFPPFPILDQGAKRGQSAFSVC
jgi:hypothetical protein